MIGMLTTLFPLAWFGGSAPDYSPFIEVASSLSAGAVTVSLILGGTMIICTALRGRK